MIKKSILALLAVFLALPLYAGTNFPTSIDTYADKNASDVITSSGWNNMQDAIEALETKVGADSSAESTSHDYKIDALEADVTALEAYYSSSGVEVDDLALLHEIGTTSGVVVSDLTLLHEIGTTSGVVVSDLTRLHQIMNTAGVSIERLPLGYVQRSKFTYIDTDTITIGPGVYHHSGTTNQLVYWNSTLTFDSTDTGSQWYYIYIDDSAIVTAGTNLLTASEFINSTTGPTWSDAKHGWYNGNDRCIFAYRVVSGSIYAFIHDGGTYIHERRENVYIDTPADNTLITIDAKAPTFCSKANFNVQVTPSSLSTHCELYVGPDITNVLSHEFYVSNLVDSLPLRHNVDIYINSSGDIELRIDLPTSGIISAFIARTGWYLPNGM